MSEDTAPPPAPSVTLGDLTVTLVEPPALFAMTGPKRDANGEADTAAALAFGAAALRMCWPAKTTWPAKPRPQEWYPGVDVVRYGGEVYEGLRKATRGRVSVYDLHRVLREAEAWSIRSGFTHAELEEAKRFLAEAEGATDASSESAESTASPHAGGTP